MTARDPLQPPRRPKSDAEQMPAQILWLLTVLVIAAAFIGALAHG
jgi:hypothetical protein